jgi:hypothetical protein
VACWGSGYGGTLGVGSEVDRATPEAVDLPPAIDLAAANRTTCALDSKGTVRCWGTQYWRSWGVGTGDSWSETQPTPIEVMRVAGAERVVVGNAAICLSSRKSTTCRGYDATGKLGPATEETIDVTWPGVSAVALGDRHSCVVKDKGVSCRGRGPRSRTTRRGAGATTPWSRSASTR